MFILRIISDINDVPQLSFALSLIPMCHTLCLCFFQRSTQLYGSQNKYFEYPSYLCSMPCLTFSMHEYQMTRGRGQIGERDFFPNNRTFKAGGICLEASEIFPLISGNDCLSDSRQHWLLGRWVKKHSHVPPNVLLVAFLAVNFGSIMICWVPPHC